MRQFNVWLRSVPGPYEQYDGKVTVWAEDDNQAIERAFEKLRRGAFPDRNRSMWRVERIELVGKAVQPC